jgi:putative transposase
MDTSAVQPIRKRMRRRDIAGGTRFVTFSCQRRLALLGNPSIRDLFLRQLAVARREHGFELFAWVVMPEHVHLLLRPRGDGLLDEALRSLKTSVARLVVGRWREIDAPILERMRTRRGLVRYWQKGAGSTATCVTWRSSAARCGTFTATQWSGIW